MRPLCLSAETDAAFGRVYLPRVSVARGNIVLADHGRTIADEALGAVSSPTRSWAPGRGLLALSDAGARPRSCTETICDRPEAEATSRASPLVLAKAPLTFAAPLDAVASAKALLEAAGLPQPALTLIGTLDGVPRDYTAVRNLLGSGPDLADRSRGKPTGAPRCASATMSTACAPMPEPASSRLTASDSAREATSAKTGWSMCRPGRDRRGAQHNASAGRACA